MTGYIQLQVWWERRQYAQIWVKHTGMFLDHQEISKLWQRWNKNLMSDILWHTWGMNCSSCQRFQKPPACKAPTTESNWVLRAKFFRTGRAEYKFRRVSWPTWKGLYLRINQIYWCWFEMHYPRSKKKVCLKSATNACGMILAAPLSTIAWFCVAWASFEHLTTPLE